MEAGGPKGSRRFESYHADIMKSDLKRELMTKKKTEQLGMNPSTASGRLVKDILWSLIVRSGQHICCKCGEEMTRDTFSIEHLTPWLDCDDPVGLYFDLNNIAFSHQKCNYESRRVPNKKYSTPEERRLANARISRESWGRLSKEDQKMLRREKYLRNGK